MNKDISILAIESSCDDTSAAVCKNGYILSNVIANQHIHQQYGGVVPELASRAHIQHIVPTVSAALEKANCSLTEIDAIAFTQGPGLIGSLLIGSQFAKSMAMVLQKPLIAVHHIHAHVWANLIEKQKPSFPFLCLTVSGGHTQIVIAHHHHHIEIIGTTIDDAAGEAFDKIAKILGLSYPGGPLIDQYAKNGNMLRFTFAYPKVNGLNFSFSGLKTSVLYFLKKELKKDPQFIEKNLTDLSASVQYTIVRILLDKIVQASTQTNIKEICLAGGVSANSYLRSELVSLGQKNNWQTYIPPFSYCTDNAAMIAITAYYQYKDHRYSDLYTPVLTKM